MWNCPLISRRAHIRLMEIIGYAWTSQLLRKQHMWVSCTLQGATDNPQIGAFNSRFDTESRSEAS